MKDTTKTSNTNVETLVSALQPDQTSSTASTSEIRRIIDQYGGSTAFVLGNGINRFYSKESLSWEKLLLDLWNQYTDSEVKQTEIFKGISFTEFYDAIEIQNTGKEQFGTVIQKEVKEPGFRE